MPREFESESTDQSADTPHPTAIRPDRSRMVPPRNEVAEWNEIVTQNEKRQRTRGRIKQTATVDGGTLVEWTDQLSPSQQPAPGPVTTLPLPCSACGSPRSSGAKFCNACGLPFDNSPVVASSPRPPALPQTTAAAQDDQSHIFHCQNCGSDIATSAGQRAYRCPFCDSNYVAEIDSTATDRRAPEFVIGFGITREQALEKFGEWIQRRSWFRPSDLSLRAVSEKQMGVYVPFWHYAYAAKSSWNAMIGQYWYRTETYRVKTSDGKWETRTRTVRETEWDPLSGQHERYYFGYLVSASKGLTQQESLSIQPYDLRALTRFQSFYLAGWISEEYAIDYTQAQTIAEEEFRSREINNIRQMMPGDTHSGLQVNTHFELNETDLILLPVHILSYRYRDRVYRFLVNGQTGKFAGEKPISSVRIAVAIIFGLILVAAIVVLVLILNGAAS